MSEERAYRKQVDDIARLDPVSWQHYKDLMAVILDRGNYGPEMIASKAIALTLVNSDLGDFVQELLGHGNPDDVLDLDKFNVDVIEKRSSIPVSALQPSRYTRAIGLGPLSINLAP